ncbi:MAG: diaminopropionate ammonia-lyase [Oscillospiraceae bacterium]|nr:diaminopropionate ammonia-lyase [Oscillospiraceae bacterium]MCL2278110.1 diaminopropionate ammonia-lyase [Oscillospiraceae bacterium]
MIKWVSNTLQKSDCAGLALMEPDVVKRIREFHRSFPQYAPTPLVSLDRLAESLGIGGIYLKDESYRFGLNSFKALGCTFAIASYIAQVLGKSVWELDYSSLPAAASELGEFTFYAATDGNHGRAVAWAARELGQRAVVYMNKGCSEVRLRHILNEGAEASISELNYDDTIRFVRGLASASPNSEIIQDTAWEGYEDIPGWIMQGYAVMALEACEQLEQVGVVPTHVSLQAGVGAFAGSAQAFVSNFYGDMVPKSFVVEPHVADCYYRSALRGDGEVVNVGGEMRTIMAGLACGEPSPVSWDIMKSKSDYFASIDDADAARAMRVLGAPLEGDTRVISGESGASGMGFLLGLLTNDDLADLRADAGVGKDSHFLVFSTEGDTDPQNYRDIVWNGKFGIQY